MPVDTVTPAGYRAGMYDEDPLARPSDQIAKLEPSLPKPLPVNSHAIPSQTWQERRAEILKARAEMARYGMYPMRWGERRPIPILPNIIRHLWAAKIVGFDRPLSRSGSV